MNSLYHAKERKADLTDLTYVDLGNILTAISMAIINAKSQRLKDDMTALHAKIEEAIATGEVEL